MLPLRPRIPSLGGGDMRRTIMTFSIYARSYSKRPMSDIGTFNNRLRDLKSYKDRLSLFNATRQSIRPNLQTYMLVMKSLAFSNVNANSLDRVKMLRAGVLLWRSIDPKLLDVAPDRDRAYISSLAITMMSYLDTVFSNYTSTGNERNEASLAATDGETMRIYRSMFGEHEKLPVDEAMDLVSSFPGQIHSLISPRSYGDLIGALCKRRRTAEALKLFARIPPQVDKDGIKISAQRSLHASAAFGLIVRLCHSRMFSDSVILSVFNEARERHGVVFSEDKIELIISHAVKSSHVSFAQAVLNYRGGSVSSISGDQRVSFSSLLTEMINVKLESVHDRESLDETRKYLNRIWHSTENAERRAFVRDVLPSFLNHVIKSPSLSTSLKKMEVCDGLRRIIDCDGEITNKSYGIITEMYSRCGQAAMTVSLWNNYITDPRKKLRVFKVSTSTELSSEDRFILGVLSDAKVLERLRTSNHQNDRYNTIAPLLSIVIDCLGFHGSLETLDQLYKQVTSGELEDYVPTIQLNHYNSFIEAYARRGRISQSWAVFIDNVLPAVESRKFFLEAKTLRPLLYFAYKNDRAQFKTINDFVRRRWPNQAFDPANLDKLPDFHGS